MFGDEFRVTLYHNGTVEWWLYGLLKTVCELDADNLPFDQHECHVHFER
jgi:hypothetical protein